MIPTKYVNLTNQEVMDKLSQTAFKSEDGNVYLAMDPIGVSDIIQEVRNRFLCLQRHWIFLWHTANRYDSIAQFCLGSHLLQ